jgi:hypothetical protein
MIRERSEVGGLLPVLAAAALASLLVAIAFHFEGHRILDLADEGFLWYGTWQTRLGAMPIRDFKAYDIGRYYWGALWSSLFGGGVVALRISTALFEIAGISLGLLTVRAAARRLRPMIVAAILFVLWAFFRPKLFEPAVSLGTVYFLARWIERPSRGRAFALGCSLGIAALVGRNLGLYGLLASALALIFVRWRRGESKLGASFAGFVAGLFVGYLPMPVLLLTDSLFRQRYLGLIGAMFQRGVTNLTLPVPWPWTVPSNMPEPAFAITVANGLFFLLLPLFYALGLACGYFRPRERGTSELVAATLVGIPYLHHIFSRADLPHLGDAIHPFLLGAAVLPSCAPKGRRRNLAFGALGGVALLSLLSAGNYHRNLLLASRVPVDVLGDRLLVSHRTRSLLEATEKLRRGPRPEMIAALPNWPGLYVILQQRSPVWNIYAVFAASEAAQYRMISEIQRNAVTRVILNTEPIDGRPDRTFAATHPLVWKFLQSHFSRAPLEGVPGFLVFSRKSIAPQADSAQSASRRQGGA